MMTVGDRIAQYRKARGMTQQQLAAEIGTVKQTVGNYERSEREPTMGMIDKIAQVLGVSKAALLGIQDADDTDSIGERLTNYMILNGDTAASLALALRVNIETIQRICADDLDLTLPQAKIIASRYGIPLEKIIDLTIDEDDTPSLPSNMRSMSDLHRQRVPLISKVPADQPILAETDYEAFVDAPIDCDVALEIQDNSMVPTYLPGDIVYIKHRQDGQVAVVLLEDEATLKHVYKRPNGLMLTSDNPDYEPIMVTENEHEYIAIYGIPVGYTRMHHQI